MSRHPTRRRAILFVLGAALLFAGAAACIKALEAGVPLAMVVLFRSLFALPIMVPILLANGGWRALRTTQPGGHAWRTFFGLVGMAGAFHGYATLPLATVAALGFTMPLFLTLLSIPLLGERVGWRRFTAVAMGFLGVLLILRPGLDAPGHWTDYAAVLVAALGWALAMITIRRMGAAGEPGAAIVLWFAIGASLVSLAFAFPVWVWPSGGEWVLLVGAGLISGVAQLLMTEAYRSGDASAIAPFEYSGIIWTGALGWLVWAEAPDAWDAAGIAVLVGCGIYIWHRERVRAAG